MLKNRITDRHLPLCLVQTLSSAMSIRTFSSPKPGQFLCQGLVWLNCLLSPTQEALPPNGLAFTSICLTRTQVDLVTHIPHFTLKYKKLQVFSKKKIRIIKKNKQVGVKSCQMPPLLRGDPPTYRHPPYQGGQGRAVSFSHQNIKSKSDHYQVK